MKSNNNIDIISTLLDVEKVEVYNGYKAVTLGDSLDYTSYIYKNNEFIGTVNWGFSDNYIFNLEESIENKDLYNLLPHL